MKTKYTAPIHTGYQAYIKPNYIVLKENWEFDRERTKTQNITTRENFKTNSHEGTLSIQAQRKLKGCVNWLVSAAKYKRVFVRNLNKNFYFKINFVTLTIPPQSGTCVDSKMFQKCLNTFLTYHRKYSQLTNYVWKIEASEDGRLHVHITADTFLHYKDVRNTWNRILQSNALLDEHFNKFNNYDPNSTDIHSVRKVKNLAAYICEYMSKKPCLPSGYRGRLWGCSSSLSECFKCSAEIQKGNESRDFTFIADQSIKEKAITGKPNLLGEVKRIATLYCVEKKHWLYSITGSIQSAYRKNIERIRSFAGSSEKLIFEVEFFSAKTCNEFIKNSNARLKQSFRNFAAIPVVVVDNIGLDYAALANECDKLF